MRAPKTSPSDKPEDVPTLRVSEIVDNASQYIGREVKVQGYFVSPTLVFWREPRRRRNETVDDYVFRCECASSSVELCYLIDLDPDPQYTYDDRYITVDERKKEFIINHRNLYLPKWQRFWPVLVPLYQVLGRRFSAFTKHAVRIDRHDLCECLNLHGISRWVLTDYSYKFPATITGILGRDKSPEFMYRLHTISRISVPEFEDRIHHDCVEIAF